MESKPLQPVDSGDRGQKAEELVAGLFEAQGWQVQRESPAEANAADLVVRKGQRAYVVEVKACSEARRDRVVPLLSEAILRAKAAAQSRPRLLPLALVVVPNAPNVLVEQVREFVAQYTSDVAVGIVGWDGVVQFLDDGLAPLNVERRFVRGGHFRRARRVPNLFSDLNQWMLKVVLAPELPASLLAGPRGQYRNASQLAAAANVSVMSAFRFVQQLRDDFFLDEASRVLRLVRRDELFRRWQAFASRPSSEQAIRFLVRGNLQAQVSGLAKNEGLCLALFSAAHALKLGHVSGVPPYLYAERKEGADSPVLKGVVPVSPGELPDFILKQPSAPQSVFRGAVRQGDLLVSDALQVWLDVSGHPSRGKEQAQFIERRVLKQIMREKR